MNNSLVCFGFGPLGSIGFVVCFGFGSFVEPGIGAMDMKLNVGLGV